MTDPTPAVAATSTSTPTTTVTLQSKLDTVENTMRGVIFERNREIPTAVLALVANKHHLQVGPPGVAKTFLVDTLSKLIDFDVPSAYFRWLMTRFSTPEELFGPPSLRALENDEYRRNTTGKMPECRIAFLDEVFKANSSILNSLLTFFNEGLYFNGPVPTEVDVTLYTASNELPRDAELAAFWDRITFRHEVAPLRDAASKKKMYNARLLGSAVNLQPIVTWHEILQARTEVRQVEVPEEVLDKLIDLQEALNKEGVEPTDRRFSDCLPVIQATAWRKGRTVADVDDMSLLRHVLWVDIKDQHIVDRLVLTIANPLDKDALELLDTVEALAKEARDLLANNDNKQKRRQLGVEIHGKLERASGDLEKLSQKANKSGKKSDMIEDARQRIATVAATLLKELFDIEPNA